jgi:hypothetical protein
VKNIVYHVKINDIEHLQTRMRNAVTTITHNMLQATWKMVEHRPDIYLHTKGAHIQIYYESYTPIKKALIISLFIGLTHVYNTCFPRYEFFYFVYLPSGHSALISSNYRHLKWFK